MRALAAAMIMTSFLFPSVARAQEANAVNSLVDGKSALNFEVNGDFDLTSFEGATISLKHHYADNRAYRLSISGTVSSEESEDRTPPDGRSEYEVDRYAVSLFLQRLYYHSPFSATSVFYGFGPRVGWSRQKSTGSSTFYVNRNEYVSDGWDIGLVALLGFEWFVRRDISLLAQYSSSFRYISSSSEHKSGPDSSLVVTNSSENTRVLLEADPVRFGVSLYW